MLFRSGFGVGLDGGILMSLPWSALPTFGFVARNIGGVSFPSGPAIPIGGVINKRHGIIKMVYDAGFSLSPKFAQQDRMVFALDYRDVLDVYKVDIKRRINLGIEFGAGKMLFFRAGFGRGYPSGGIGLNFSKGSFDLGTYGEELDAKGFHGVLDRRYSIRITRLF